MMWADSVAASHRNQGQRHIVFTGNYHRSGDQDQTQEWGVLRTPSAMGGAEQTLTAEMGYNSQEASRRFSSG